MIARATLLALAALIAVFVLSPAALAEPAVVGFEVQAPADLTVGDRFHYLITVEAETGTEITLAPGALPAELSLIVLPEVSSRPASAGRSVFSIALEVAAFVPGRVEIPALRLSFTEPSGASGQILTPESSIEVTSVLPSSGQIEPRDLKPQASLGSTTSLAPALISFAVVLVAVVSLAILWRKFRSRNRKQEAPAVPLTQIDDVEELGPEDQARAILDRAGLDFLEDQDHVSYYGAIALAIRNYLTERYGFPAFALTTGELDRDMQRRGIDRWQTRLVNGLLTQCDASVYARYAPAPERADGDLTSAYEIVEMSRPELQEEAPVA